LEEDIVDIAHEEEGDVVLELHGHDAGDARHHLQQHLGTLIYEFNK
jgi:hypothetical protein